jgi:L,D-peptidoglycan transpeptidase YkuD (ErfK/YbiS/YcfS/YnhG family)
MAHRGSGQGIFGTATLRGHSNLPGGRTWHVRRAPGGPPHRAIVCCGAEAFPASIGRTGVSVRKREGDGATPAALLRVSAALARRDRLPVLANLARLKPITRDAGWCDDCAHPRYNRPVSLPFAASHEDLHRRDALYDFLLVLDWNEKPRRPGAGSAIFLHVAPPDGGPTQGCLAIPRAMFMRLAATGRLPACVRFHP